MEANDNLRKDIKPEAEMHEKCSCCGRDFYHAGEGVDVFCNTKSDGNLGFEFTVKPHSKSESLLAVAVLCFACLKDWFQSQGMTPNRASEIIRAYKCNLQKGD